MGLPTAAVLASRGYEVRGVEINRPVVMSINAGHAPIFEPDLEMLVRAAVNTGKLKAHEEPAESDVFLLCVPTPLRDAYVPDLSHVTEATRAVALFVRAGNLIILESTRPRGRPKSRTFLSDAWLTCATSPNEFLLLPAHHAFEAGRASLEAGVSSAQGRAVPRAR